MKKKHVLLTVSAFYAWASTAQSDAESGVRYLYKINSDKPGALVQWTDIQASYSPWVDAGGHYDCGGWFPSVSMIPFGDAFIQNRHCQQDQIRSKTAQQQNKITQETRDGVISSERRSVPIDEDRESVGEKDAITGESGLGWSAFIVQGAPYDCGLWTPPADAVQLYESYEQTRLCTQDQVRTQQFVHNWLSGKQTPSRTDSEVSTTQTTEAQPAIGTKDYIQGERLGTWSAWVVDGESSCAAWSPDPATHPSTDDFVQTRDCQQAELATRDVFDMWRSGAETLNRTESRQKTAHNTESRAVSVSWTSWENSGDPHHCSAWSPDANTVTNGTNFTQTRSCQQDKSRVRNYIANNTSIGTLAEAKTDTLSESKNAVGTKIQVTPQTLFMGAYLCDRCSDSRQQVVSRSAGYQTVTFNASFEHEAPGDVTFSVSSPCGNWNLGVMAFNRAQSFSISQSCNISGAWRVTFSDLYSQDTGTVYLYISIY